MGAPHRKTSLTREEQLAHIYGQVASGRALTRVLDNDEGMPSRTEFWRWHMDDETIRDNLARARLNGVESLLDEAIDIANTPQIGEVVTHKFDKDGEPIEEKRTEDMLGHRKLQVETRIKMAQMIAPRKYGPKVDVTSDNKPLAGVSAGDVAARVAAIMQDARERRDSGGEAAE